MTVTGGQVEGPELADSQGLADAEKLTRQMARGHYENFLVASVLLPRRLRQPFFNVYAFCRTADDLADESESREAALRGLADFQNQLDGLFAGQTNRGLFMALADTVARFDLDKQPFDDLLDAFRQDQSTTRYQTYNEVADYCRRSANPVGRIVLALADCSDDENIELSDQICTGLQLVNFLQDVARDFELGRIYLAAQEMQRFGVDEEMFRLDQTPQPLRDLISSECDRAERLFLAGLPLAERVPRWFASDVRLFAHGGLLVIKAIRGTDFDVLRNRPTVSKWAQTKLLMRAATGFL